MVSVAVQTRTTVRLQLVAVCVTFLLALAGAFYFIKDFPIRLKRHPIPGTIALQKVALMSYSAGANQQ